ncbi:hypothetical protein ACFWCD_35215, partial [Streptomyces goshikiensis]|uniref:hypothetical protein n=1 Tax=Streptomyces goshikiensis TaxID=1942 RepID=UPI0036967849
TVRLLVEAIARMGDAAEGGPAFSNRTGALTANPDDMPERKSESPARNQGIGCRSVRLKHPTEDLKPGFTRENIHLVA